MSTDPTSSDHSNGHEPRLSRRRMLFGGAVGMSALALGRLGSGSAGAVGGELNEPGSALETAFRVNPPTTTTIPTATATTTTTTTTTTTPTTSVVPASTTEVGEGEILFPIVVGPDDSCFLNNNFGACRSGCSRRHEGTDIMADHLLPIRAVCAGVLTKKYVDSGSTSGAGNGWTLYEASTNITYKFFHMDHHEEGLEAGDTVELGQIIGAVGNTGTSGTNSGTNYHLHFEYRPGNIAQNAYNLLQRAPNVSFA
jgi:murein DD-endopeptidase MepM/ murein hydrolase activator NlpD